MSLWLKKARVSLKRNPNIKRITDQNVAYTSSFKKYAVQEYEKGISPREIFKRKGFDLSLFPKNYARETLKRWRKTVKNSGTQGLEEDHRGKNSSGRPRKRVTKELNTSELRARVAYLEAEVDFLKKIRALATRGK